MNIKKILKSPAFILTVFILLQFLLKLSYLAPDDIYTTDSYFHVREIEHIRSQGTLMTEDNFSVYEKIYHFTPLFHYVMAVLLTFFSKFIVFKIFPILFSLLTIPATYLLLQEILTEKKYIYLISFCVGLLPGVVLTSTSL